MATIEIRWHDAATGKRIDVAASLAALEARGAGAGGRGAGRGARVQAGRRDLGARALPVRRDDPRVRRPPPGQPGPAPRRGPAPADAPRRLADPAAGGRGPSGAGRAADPRLA